MQEVQCSLFSNRALNFVAETLLRQLLTAHGNIEDQNSIKISMEIAMSYSYCYRLPPNTSFSVETYRTEEEWFNTNINIYDVYDKLIAEILHHINSNVPDKKGDKRKTFGSEAQKSI